MRKLLLLGGSSQQVIAITTAKKMGYYTILCDYLPDNPGQYEADEYYQISTTDKEAVLKIAKEKKIEGIVAYSSDPAAPTAAYVSEKLQLPGIPYNTAHTFCDKRLFRKFLKDNGFNVPQVKELFSTSDYSAIVGLTFPVIIKPSDSSGSKGVSVINNTDEFIQARDLAVIHSKNKRLIAEEYIVRDHPDVIEAEVFVIDGQVAVWGIIDSIRDNNTNPLVPAAYSYPTKIDSSRFELVKNEVSRLIRCGNISYGALNIEMVITIKNELYFLDVGPRNGGNMLPKFIGMIMDGDLEEATVCSAMGDYERINHLTLDGQKGGYWGLVVIHSSRDGVFQGIYYSEDIKTMLQKEMLFTNVGGEVFAFSNARDAIGLAFFKFPSAELRDEVLNDFEGKYLRPLLS